MNHFASPDFWYGYRHLPPEVRELADKKFDLLRQDPAECREMVRRPCPNDAMLIPQVAEVPGAAGSVRFFWCGSCMELSAFLREPDRLVARFGADGGGGWKLFRAVGLESEVRAAAIAASQVQPDTGTLSTRDPLDGSAGGRRF